jgi:hypothetical protein
VTYTLDESHTSRNITPNANVMATFGYPRDIKYITIHHWGNNGQQFDVVRDYLCTNTTPTSAHFVVEDGQVACIVSPDDAAWHAGNAQGNAQSIGIECRPEHTDGDYQTVGELVAWLRSQYGDLPLVPHNYWTSTACPGDYDLNRIDAIARGASVTPQSGTITPIQEDDMSYSQWPQADRVQLLEDIKNVLKPTQDRVIGAIPAGPARTAIPGIPRATDNGDIWDIRQDISHVAAAVAALPAAVWNQNIGAGNAAGVLTHVAAQPAGTAAVASVDVDALATKLAATLPPAVVAQLAAQLAKL